MAKLTETAVISNCVKYWNQQSVLLSVFKGRKPNSVASNHIDGTQNNSDRTCVWTRM